MDARSYPSDDADLGDRRFRPEVFFSEHTEGSGLVRDPFGRILRRCRIVTDTELGGAYDKVHFEEVYTYDDGEVDVWRWAISDGEGGRYMASESLAGPGIVGCVEGDDFTLRFRRPVGRARGLLAPSFHARFTLMLPGIALKVVKVSLFGAPLGVLSAIHRRPDVTGGASSA